MNRPIEDAALFPAAIVFFGPGNSSDEEGRLKIYQIKTCEQYEIMKNGYQAVSIPYPDKNNSIVTLKETPNHPVQPTSLRSAADR